MYARPSNTDICTLDPLTQIYVHSLSGLGICTWMKCGGVRLFLSAQASSLSDMMRPCKCFPHVRLIGLWRSTPLMQTLPYKLVNSVIIKNDIKGEKLKFSQLGFLYYCLSFIKCIIWVNGNTYFNKTIITEGRQLPTRCDIHYEGKGA